VQFALAMECHTNLIWNGKLGCAHNLVTRHALLGWAEKYLIIYGGLGFSDLRCPTDEMFSAKIGMIIRFKLISRKNA